MNYLFLCIFEFATVSIIFVLPFDPSCSVILLPLAITFYITWWFIHFVDGFFSPIYAQLGINIFGKNTKLSSFSFICLISYNLVSNWPFGIINFVKGVSFFFYLSIVISLNNKNFDINIMFLQIHVSGLGFVTSVTFIFVVGIFMSSWLGASVLSLGEWFIKRMPFVRHIYDASKQISTAISPGWPRLYIFFLYHFTAPQIIKLSIMQIKTQEPSRKS